MSMRVLTWKPRIGLWLIGKTLKVNWLTWVVCWQRAATAVLMSQKKKRLNWLTRVVCWQKVATAVSVSQSVMIWTG